MTSMIDVVFLLLIFFVMTFKIAMPEGDFSVAMAAPGPGTPPPVETLYVRLKATPDGQLAGVYLGSRQLADMPALRREVRALVGDSESAASQWRVELDCDHALNYRHVIAAMTAATGYTDAHGNLVRLISKINIRSRPQH
jgi:biopolymer transport protein ExbD